MNDYDDEKNVNFERALPASPGVALLSGRKIALPQPDQLAVAEAADLVLHPEVVAPPSASPQTREEGLCEALSDLRLMTHLPMDI
eukprot:12319414-Heterocapsa_arctica.AAC.1